MVIGMISLLAWTLASWSIFLPYVGAQCNPLVATCPPNPGLGKDEYFVDFTQESALPKGWILANYATVTYGANGAEFSFKKRYDAPYIWTNFYILFGRVDVVMQAAPGTGIISSAVLMSDTQDEIDWEWSGNNFGAASGKVQTNYFGKGITGSYDRGTQPDVDSPQTKFHTYSFDWTPTVLTWSIDGKTIRSLKAADADEGAHQYPQTPSRFHLGLWNAGDPDIHPGTVEWAGGYADLSQAPFTAYVRSVRITSMNPCSQYQYSDQSGNLPSIKCINETTSTISSPSVLSQNSPTSSTISSTSIESSGFFTSASLSSAAGPPSSPQPVSLEPSRSEILTFSFTQPSEGTADSSSCSTSDCSTDFISSASSSASDANPEPSSNDSKSEATESDMQSNDVTFAPPPLLSLSSTTTANTFTTTPAPVNLPGPASMSPISTIPSQAPKPPHHCHHDDCLRNLLDRRYSYSASSLCSSIPTSTLPVWLSGCRGQVALRVSSACACLKFSATNPTAPTTTDRDAAAAATATAAATTAAADVEHAPQPSVKDEKKKKKQQKHKHPQGNNGGEKSENSRKTKIVYVPATDCD